MEYKYIIYSKEGKIAKTTFNQPKKLNPFVLESTAELIDVIKRVKADDEVKVLIFKGNGRAFSAGGDISDMAEMIKMNPGKLQEQLDFAHQIVVLLTKLEKIVIAQIHGFAYGAGLDFTLGCDLRIASSDTKFCEAYLKVGLSPGMGALYMLPRYVGFGRALKLILTSQVIDASEAERIGLVDVVVPPEELDQTTMEYAQNFAEGPSKALAITKRALHRGLISNFETEQLWTSYEQVTQLVGKDTREGMIAFLEKRKPKFSGKY